MSVQNKNNIYPVKNKPDRILLLIETTGHPFGYNYNVQLWINNYYAGHGSFFKTKKDALKYIKEQQQNGNKK